jgi:hypothetical protein
LSTEPDESGTSAAARQLKILRDKILALKVIWVQLDNEDDAYVIFETLNSRGKDLEPIDLLKNLLLSAVTKENGDLDTAKLRWNSMREKLEVGLASPNKYLLHWWLARGVYTAERRLYRTIKSSFDRTEASAQEMLADLEEKSSTYVGIVAPSRANWKHHEKLARSSLEALNIFNVSQPRPFLLALLTAYNAGLVKYKRVRTALRSIESYHFITNAVVGVSSTGGVSKMYASHAVSLTKSANGEAANAAISALLAKLNDSERKPSRDQFIAAFVQNLRFSEDETKDKRLVQYVLRELHEFLVVGVPTDHSKCNIEHLHPHSSGDPWSASIGNLLWVDEELNQLLGTLPFAGKQKLLASRAGVLDVADIITAEEWGSKEVEERARRLAKIGYDKVWLVSG